MKNGVKFFALCGVRWSVFCVNKVNVFYITVCWRLSAHSAPEKIEKTAQRKPKVFQNCLRE